MKVLIIGLGSVARKHITAIKELFPEAEIIALRSSKSSLTEAGIQNIHNLNELSSKPDFIIISNPTYLHAATIISCASIGVPIMIEKPSFHRLNDTDSVLNAIESNNVLSYIACNMRFHPAIQYLKDNIERRRINEVNIYCGSFLPDWRKGVDYKDNYSAKIETGGGVHLDLIHEIDYCCWIFGKPQFSRSIKRSTSHLNISSVDFAHYNLEYPEFVANITLNYYRKDAKRTIDVLMDDDTWNIDLLQCVIRNSSGTIIFNRDYNILETYLSQMEYFIGQINKKQQPMNNIREAIDILKICLRDE